MVEPAVTLLLIDPMAEVNRILAGGSSGLMLCLVISSLAVLCL